MLECDRLRKSFGALIAVNDVSFRVEEGEILGIIGPNGAGKTTVFDCIVGLQRPESGRILFHNQNIVGLRPHRICRLGIAKTSQITDPFRTMTVYENVLVAALHGAGMSMREARTEALRVLALVGLQGQEHKGVLVVPLAVRRRLELARALATGAQLLLLDEAMAGLNPREIVEALHLLRKLRDSGKSLLVVEHVLSAIMGISDRILVLHHGVKIAEGSPETVMREERVIEAYLGRKFRNQVTG